MKKKHDAGRILFLIGRIEKPAKVSAGSLKSQLWAVKSSGIDAVSVVLKGEKDFLAAEKIYPLVKENSLFLLGEIAHSYKGEDKLSVDGIKTGYGIWENKKLLSLCAERKLPLFVSVPLKKVRDAVREFKGVRKKYRFPITFMLNELDDDTFRRLVDFKRKYRSLYIGYEAGKEAVSASLIALAWGARVIEKHLSLRASTHSKSISYGLGEFKVFAALLREGCQYVK